MSNPIRLADLPTGPSENIDEDKIKDLTDDLIKEFGRLQNVMYAQKKYSLLVILQGMDAAGKDSAARDVFKYINPMCCTSYSFKKPSEEEMRHDFLWRVHKVVPEKGMITIFNRSHYEDVLIQRVHKWIDEDRVRARFQHINAFEKLLADNGTIFIKFFLNISKERQLEKLLERTTIPRKFWKHNDNDHKERQHWEEYMHAYQDVVNECGPEIPWYIIPSDRNWYKEYVMVKHIVEKLKSLNMEYPPLETELSWDG